MSVGIKQSELEQRWYYRALKVFLLVLPIVLLLLLFFKYRNVVCTVVPPGVPDPMTAASIVVGLILYYVLLRLVRWLVLYLVFGGVQDDMQVRPATLSSSQSKGAQLVPVILLLILLMLVILVQTGRITLPKFFSDGAPKPSLGCPATSAQTSTPCGRTAGGIGTSGIIVPARCNCPSDTEYASMDNVTAGGPYKICVCK